MNGIDITDESNVDLLNRQVANNITGEYKPFLSKINRTLLKCFEHMEENANMHHDESENTDDGEVKLSYIIQTFLKGADIPCSTEQNSNGHVDLTISEGNFKWLGEAKIQKGEGWSYHGFRQLTENYSTGRSKSKYGGIIIYNKLKRKSSKACADEFKAHLLEKHENLEIKDFTENCYFDLTMPEHPRSGNPYNIRTYYVNLHYTESTEFDNK